MEVADYEQTLGIGSRRRLASIYRNRVRRVDGGIMRTLRVYLTSRLLVFGRRQIEWRQGQVFWRELWLVGPTKLILVQCAA